MKNQENKSSLTFQLFCLHGDLSSLSRLQLKSKKNFDSLLYRKREKELLKKISFIEVRISKLENKKTATGVAAQTTR